MSRLFLGCVVLSMLSFQMSAVAAAPIAVTGELSRPTKAFNFQLLDHQGRAVELHREGVGAKAIVLYVHGNGCPIVRQSLPQLKELRDIYAPQGVKFFMLNANPQDDRESVAAEAQEFGVEIPIMIDETQFVVKDLGCTRTAEAILINPANWDIVYRGAIDDRNDYLAAKNNAQHMWLQSAIDALLAGTPVEPAETPAKGCLITYKAAPEAVSYQRDIVPILKDHCVSCHSPGNVAPFAFSSHSKVEGWSEMIKEVILTKRMPPWHADPHLGAFANDRGLTTSETRTLLAWLERGAPKDGDADPLRELMATAEGPAWPLGEPDMVVELPEAQTIPASGVFEYAYVEVPSGLTEDKWVRAVDVQTTNRKVTHHVLVFLRYPDTFAHLQPDQEGGLLGFFGGYVPGQQAVPFPEGSGKWIPAGTTFIFQLHYNATGKEETDRSRMGLYFLEEPPARELVTTAAFQTDFVIEPNDADSETSAKHVIPRDAILYGMSPHMHYRGKRFQYEAQYPDGKNELLLSVPQYDFDWQTMYELAEPKKLPAGTVVTASGAFDNSAANPYNPNPDQAVYFGEQTYEEMFIGYLMYTVDPQQPSLSMAELHPEFEWFPLTAETLVGTAWKMGEHVVAFEPDGRLLVNDSIPGTWSIDGDKIAIAAVGRDIHFVINNDHLTTRRGHVLERVK